MPKQVLVVSARMGAGHDGAAKEICKRLESNGYTTRIVDFLDASPRAGKILYDTYHFQIERSPWTYSALYWAWSKFPILAKLTTLAFSFLFEARLREWAEEFEADAIVTTYPFASVVLGRARTKRRKPLQIPAITFLTDFAVHPLWVHEGIDEHVCVSPSAASGVRHLLRSPRISVSGPFVSPDFFQFRDSVQLRDELGIPQDQIAVLLAAGSWGVGDIESTFKELASNGSVFPVIVCGHNEVLRSRLQGIKGGLVIGWTQRMADLMACTDAVVQNAGGLTALEAFASGTPVVSYRPIPGHGKDNTKRMQLSGVTISARGAGDLVDAIQYAVDRGDNLTSSALSLFEVSPERHIISAIEDAEHTPTRTPRPPAPPSKVLSRLALAASATFLAANVTANVVGEHGLNVDKAYARLPYVYLAVRPGLQNITSSALSKSLVRNDIAAVIPLTITESNAAAVRQIATEGITIINGGSTADSSLHLILPQNALAGNGTLLSRITGEAVAVSIPQEQLNGVDLAWAALHHQVLPKTKVLNFSSNVPIVPGATVYEINGSKLSTSALIRDINITIRRVRSKGYVVASVTTLT